MATPRCQASPSQLPPVKTPKEKKTRPAPLTGLPGCSQRASSKDAEEGRRAFDLGSAVTRGSAHSGRLTPRAELPGSLHSNGTPSHGLRSHHLPLPTSVPGSSGAFTSSSVGDMLEVSGLEELERLGKLGQGCSGVVEKHRHLPTGRELALKILQAADIAEPQRKAILLELRTFSKCRSPHIVDFYGAFFHENNIYMALEYMNAGALSATLAAKKKAIPDFHVPDRLLANITWQVLDGLEYLHSEMHVIHRDIKPSNLLLSTTGIVKITDFGVSGELEDDLEHKNKVTFVGTIHYMSPERVVGKPYKYNSDTWSLGLTLMECVLMRYPYAREEEVGYKFSFWELMRRIDKQEPPSLPPCPQYSPKLQEFLQEALQKDPEHRPGAAAMKAHGWLEGFQSGHLVELAMWIAQTPEEAPRTGPSRPLRHGPNPFQGGYSSSGPSKAPDREMPPRLPEGSLRPPRCPASSGGHTAASSPDASDTRRSDSLPVDMPKMDQSWHGGRCNPFSAFQAEVGASPEARSRTSSRGAEGEFLS
ncbi:unnamed protein product [Effrenium voratum]|nr:unnamed protein product [Effrenium voratum]